MDNLLLQFLKGQSVMILCKEFNDARKFWEGFSPLNGGAWCATMREIDNGDLKDRDTGVETIFIVLPGYVHIESLNLILGDYIQYGDE